MITIRDRYQVVKVTGYYGSSQLVRSGIPQGTVLGPILFFLFIAPLAVLHLLEYLVVQTTQSLYVPEMGLTLDLFKEI